MDIQGANVEKLRADAALTALVGTYAGGPAVLAAPVPDDFAVGADPVAIVDVPVSDEPADDYSQPYRQVTFRVRLYQRPDEFNGGPLPLINAAERARALLRGLFNEAITNGEIVSSEVAGPEDAPTSDTAVAGRLLTVRQFIKEGT